MVSACGLREAERTHRSPCTEILCVWQDVTSDDVLEDRTNPDILHAHDDDFCEAEGERERQKGYT